MATFRDAWNSVLSLINTNPVWLASIEGCIQEVAHALEIGGVDAAVPVAAFCASKLATEFGLANFSTPNFGLVLSKGPFTGGGSMACTNSHKTSATTQGPGVCCAALGASGLTPAVGVRVAAVNSAGKCIVCEVKASTSRKNPGALVFKRGKSHMPGSAVSCPTSQEGCCALAGA